MGAHRLLQLLGRRAAGEPARPLDAGRHRARQADARGARQGPPQRGGLQPQPEHCRRHRAPEGARGLQEFASWPPVFCTGCKPSGAIPEGKRGEGGARGRMSGATPGPRTRTVSRGPPDAVNSGPPPRSGTVLALPAGPAALSTAMKNDHFCPTSRPERTLGGGAGRRAPPSAAEVEG